MIEREYPRWVHAAGQKSVIVQSADEENEVLAAWAAEPAKKPEPQPAAFTSDDIARAYADGISAALNAAQAHGVSKDDIDAIRAALDAPPADNALVKKRGGWPKGKPRKATVQ